MKLTDNDIRFLFHFGMGMQLLDEEGSPTWRGKAEPHPENHEWISLWVTDGANTVLPREVEPDGVGGYTFINPSGGRRRIFPLSEADRVSPGSIDEILSTNEDQEIYEVVPPTNSKGARHIEPREKDATPPGVVYLLAHYARNGYPWGIWHSPTDYFYGEDVHPLKVERAINLVDGRDRSLTWPEWIDSMAWCPPDDDNRWDLLKGYEPVNLEQMLREQRRLRGGATYAEYVLSLGHTASYIEEMQDFFGPRASWPVFRAVSEDHNLSFNAVMAPEKDDGQSPFIGYMWPSEGKNFYMEISATEKRDDEWLVTTTNGRWALRRLTKDELQACIAALRHDGVDVGPSI